MAKVYEVQVFAGHISALIDGIAECRLPAHHYVRANDGRRSALRYNLPACTMALTAKTQS